MEVRFVCVLLTMIILNIVTSEAQTTDDPHLCVRTANVMKTKLIKVRCSRGSKEICTKIKRYYEIEERSVCCDGWVYSAAKSKCIPDCKRGCERGTCVAPETCVCDPPLILKNNNTCEEPRCDPPCVNANCVDTNKCICNEGFAVLNATSCAPICPNGFYNDPHILECKPKCKKCVNGQCTAPDTCTCEKGYILDNFTCVPQCNRSCENGKCIAPDTCECMVGYHSDPSDKSICHPICENTCLNATCVEPNKCVCFKGYEPLGTWACKPKCDQCNHGECVAPNECRCLEGYVKTDETKCMPVCSKTCFNGFCSAPNTCTCNKGYELNIKDSFKCEPICKDNCVNATCSSPDTCHCYPGFEKVNNSVCSPLCSSCDHGICVSPGNCQCKDGFTRTNGVCKPICSSSCVNGFCESPEKCACNEGYIENITESVCYKPCIGDCDNGICDIHGKCSCLLGYKLFNNSCIEPDDCDKCISICSNGDCQCDDGRPCQQVIETPAEAAPSTSLAGLQLTWALGGCIGILLMVVIIVRIGYNWKKRKEYGEKPTENGTAYPSVLYTIPNTLIQNKFDNNRDYPETENDDEDSKSAVSLHLLEGAEDASEKKPV